MSYKDKEVCFAGEVGGWIERSALDGTTPGAAASGPI
jgi:hypothetical protein